MANLNYVQCGTLYNAGSGTVVGATSIVLTSLTDIYGNILTMASFGSKGYGTQEPDTSNEEAFTFTGIVANANGTYTLTGVSTALAQSPYTETAGLIRQHSGSTKVVVTDNVAWWNTFGNKQNDEALVGRWTTPVTPSNPNDLVNKNYVDTTAVSGAADASTTVKGVVRLSASPNGTPTALTSISNASPAVFTLTAHGLTLNDSIVLTTTGTLPTGLATATKYFVIAAGLTANAFEVSASLGGAAINTSSAGSGTHSFTVTTPVAVGTFDTRIPTVGQAAALPGNNTDIPVGAGNTFVTETGLQHNSETFAVDSGSSTAYVAALSPIPTSLTNGMTVRVKMINANTTTTPTLNVNGLGAKTIVKATTTALAVGDIGANSYNTFVYDSTNTVWVLQSPIANIPISGQFSVNADETNNTYWTHEVPINGTATTIYGWICVQATLGASSSQSAGGYIQLSGSTSANFTLATTLPGSTGGEVNYNYGDTKIVKLKTRILFNDTSDRKGWGLCLTPSDIHTAQTDITNGEIRFILNGATLYAQCANGAATSVDVTAFAVSGVGVFNTYEIIFTPGVNAKFYINGTLAATISTNLPTTGGVPYLAYGCNANGRIVNTTFPIVSIQN